MENKIMIESTLASSVRIGESLAEEIADMIQVKIAEHPENVQRAMRYYVWGCEIALDKHYNHERG